MKRLSTQKSLYLTRKLLIDRLHLIYTVNLFKVDHRAFFQTSLFKKLLREKNPVSITNFANFEIHAHG